MIIVKASKKKLTTPRSPHIFLAEDEPRLQSSLIFLFVGKGCVVTSATTGAEALRKFKSCRAQGMTVDLLITDIQMPQMDGELLLKAVREIDSTLPVLVMTGIGNKELVVRLMKLGCSDYIDKPFSLEELEAHVDPLLEKARRISEKIRHVDDSTDGSTRKMESMRGLK